MRGLTGRLAMGCMLMVAVTGSSDTLNAANEDDLRCLAVSAIQANSSNPDVQNRAVAAVMYWLGRLEGRNPDFDLETELTRVSESLTADDLRGEAERCGTAIRAKGQELIDIGKRMETRAGQQSL